MSQPASLDAFADMVPRTIDQVTEPVDRSEVLRYLGYPAGARPAARWEAILDHWVVSAAQRAEPRAIYRILPIADRNQRRIRLLIPGGTTEFRGAIGEFLGVARCIAAFIATAGPGVERLASELLAEGETLPAMIANAVGAERAEAAETAVIAALRARGAALQLVPTLPYSPGYCGMALTEQRPLFGLFPGTGIGVELTEHFLMRPLKSVSGLIGLGPADAVAAFASPCDRCELYNCAMRR